MGTSWVAVSINNITIRASREMTSPKHIKIFDFNGVNVAKHWYVAGEVFAISDCLVITLQNLRFFKVCWSVSFFLSAFCLRTMYRPQYWSDRPDFVPADVFWSKDHGNYFS